jgi:energy-coupling factor transporter ATP-binding protein EcfA2
LPPPAGVVERPGDAGLGRAGGTAIVFQRPESQVLGVRVRDDLVWGLPASVPCDVPLLLGLVGLDGMADRETSTLSGGELQRLAIASALARQPQLVISDESTSMLDTEGHRAVVDLLGELSRSGVAVVHVTHRPLDGAGATQVMRLGELAADGAEPPPLPERRSLRGRIEELGLHIWHRLTTRPPVARIGGERADVRLRNVGHVYASGTPWAHRALAGIDLDVAAGEGVVVTGPNGSGKSTLAWVVAGLVVPSEGDALLAGDPTWKAIGRVGLGFQHARLQLLRPTVLADVAYGADEVTARRALAEVGMDADAVGGRRVDELSGGEQRRVALAGIIARSPALVVLDEPLAGLDDETRLTLEVVLRRLRREQGVATVVVAHDLAVASGLGERLVRLAGGRVVSDGPMAGSVHARPGA